MGSRAAVLALLLTGCERDVVIGVERQVKVQAAVVDPATGDLLEAGTRESDLWYARTHSDGGFAREQRLDISGKDDALTAAVLTRGGGWAIAGYTTREDGHRQAWVRALGPDDSELWTRTYEKNGGWAAQGLTVDPAGALVVVGVEDVDAGVRQGFIASLGDAGAVSWQYSTRTDLQGMIRDLRLHAVAGIGESRQRIITVGERTVNGQSVPELSEFTVGGLFYNSYRLDLNPGTSRGLSVDLFEGTICTQRGDTIVLRRTPLSTQPELRQAVLRVDGALLELGGCAVAPDGDMLVGATAIFPDGRRVARAAKVERSATTVRWEKDVDAPETVTVAGVAADPAGSGWLFGHTQNPLRRWVAKIP